MSYWLKTTPADRFPALKNDLKTEVAVIGGGITGVSICYWLSGKYKTALLEGARLASKASGRNGGFLLTGTSDYYNRAIELYGEKKARKLWQLTQKNHDLLQRHIKKNGIECEHKRSGSYFLAVTEKERKDIEESAELMRKDGFHVKLLDENETNHLTHSKSFKGSLFNGHDGEINPVKLVLGMAKIVADLGAAVHENTSVINIRRKQGKFIIRTDRGKVESDRVIMATNAYAPLIFPRLASVVSPVRGQVVVTRPSEKLFSGVYYAHYGYEYWRQLGDGRVLAGGFRELGFNKEVGYSMTTTDKIQKRLKQMLRDLSVRTPTEFRWSGIMGFTKDKLPLVGPLIWDDFLFCGAYSGHGLGLAFICARIVSEFISGKKFYAIFSPKRFNSTSRSRPHQYYM